MKTITKKASVVGIALISLSACTLNSTTNPTNSIGFREARFNQVAKIQEFQSCKNQGMQLDSQARSRGSIGAYLNSARVLEKCEANLGVGAAGVAEEERMRVYSLSIQNYFKGGEVENARRNLNSFKATFADRDLYYADGSSFTATMETLLGRNDPTTYGQFATLNVNDQVKREMRRFNHWKKK